ncbi:acyltransferase family protein [Neisseria iguanae]|uniref:Acyltransferase n=1 Tax=Neisseria iguanae TaxID=90242 RepID=A0A2P7TXS6_9NEIS|nr:acyltransferase family protein [Neisseria iguanae]PSJ79453.1 acyltransferase [Neisseria iguanae]
MKYRREIDGLRAFAVLPVILFHAGISAFKGGYVGVDVFFVISGYLITTIILSDLDAGKFSIVEFYERRFRRILPALLFVLICIYPLAYLWLMPSEMKAFSQSLAAISLFSGNVLFWLTSGYFDTATELKPLLHTWSLGVEEQYYVLFPLLLLGLYKAGCKQWIVLLMVLLGGISFLASEWALSRYQIAVFYLLPFRAWELMAGSLAAVYLRRYSLQQKKFAVNQWGSLLGLLLVILPVFLYDKYMPFPGASVLPVILGSVLVIVLATPDTWAGKILSTKVMVQIGLISYSTYLWHNPLFALARVRSEFEVHPYPLMVALATLSLVLAYFTWRYVEAPFRNKTLFSRKRIFQISGMGSMVLFTVGLAGHFYFQKLEHKIDYGWNEHARRHSCLIQDDHQDKHAPNCYEKGDYQVLLWGDSHAASLYQGLAGYARNHDIALTQLTQSSCPPLVGFEGPVRGNCAAINQRILDEIAANHYDAVILHSIWFSEKKPVAYAETANYLAATLKQIEAVSPKSRLVVIGNTPRWHISAERAYNKSLADRGGEKGVMDAAAVLLPDLGRRLQQAAEEAGAVFIDPARYLCETGHREYRLCLLSADGSREHMLYTDADHLSKTGADILVNWMAADLEAALVKKNMQK